jgi:hypothetical protein
MMVATDREQQQYIVSDFSSLPRTYYGTRRLLLTRRLLGML